MRDLPSLPRSGALSLIFASSGLSSLVYECLWVRLLSLGVGSTSTALSFVLSIFFLGLAGGSLLGGRRAQKDSRPLRTYALIEGLIGLFALALFYPLAHFQNVLAYFPPFLTSGFLLSAVKFFLVFALLIVPTLLMGATFPLLTRVQQERASRAGTDSVGIERLYAVNTLGAALGAFATSFILIPHFGVFYSNTFAVLLNLTIFFVAGFGAGGRPQTRVAAAPLSSHTEEPLTAWEKAVQMSTAGVGFSSIAAQVVWNKYLGIFFGTNIYGLGILLGLYLGGIAGDLSCWSGG